MFAPECSFLMAEKSSARIIDGQEVRRILVVRPSAIGDVAMASPILPVLRGAFPEAEICWLLEPHIVDVLKSNPCLDRIMVWPKGAWLKLWKSGRLMELLRQMWAFARDLRRERFDLALDIQGLLRSRLLARCSGAPVRIGFDSKEPGRFLMSRIVSRGADSDRMGSEYLHMMKELGCSPGLFHPCLDVDGRDADVALAELGSAGIVSRFLAIAPFTTRQQKHWFEDRWAELAGTTASTLGMQVVVLGGPGDRDAAARICAEAGAGVLSLAGKLTLAQSMAVIRECTLLVGVDTGLTHIGPAFERPTIALFGATCPYLLTSRTNTVVLYHKQPCSPCRRSPTCDGKYMCMQDVTVAEVLECIDRLLPKDGVVQ
jgi:heptosyltransferase-1